MSELFQIKLEPLGAVVKVERGTDLRDVLFSYGVEFPCGGKGQCRGCRVKVVEGSLSINDPQRNMLTEGQIEEGWRLSCQCKVEGDLVLELAQWKTDVLVDDSLFDFTPREGLGIAVDLGTTTLVAQLVNLETGKVLGVKTALNSQARHGSDVMTRVAYALSEEGFGVLPSAIRDQIGGMIQDLASRSASSPEGDGDSPGAIDMESIADITLVGNTAMHHLFCEIDISPLSAYPFEPVDDGAKSFRAGDLGWNPVSNARVRFLPCLGGFVGSDILAGILATRMHESEEVVGLVDLGTNGEIVIGNRDRIVCASTAAGPAFEGARISSGMRAASGAIYQVEQRNGGMECRVLGNVEPRGICGSGLVDAVAVCLDMGIILPRGRFTNKEDEITLRPPVNLTQTDIRQLQLAKGAIAAGFRILLDRVGQSPETIERLYLAGAFGNYINRVSARRIGLLDIDSEKVQPVGNTALLGAKLALFIDDTDDAEYHRIRDITEHVSLSADPVFQETYAEEMLFPE
jgi:uncharacterized 2Fe-2S/4Fe-4S cluster protein (DUF4445 family)